MKKIGEETLLIWELEDQPYETLRRDGRKWEMELSERESEGENEREDGKWGFLFNFAIFLSFARWSSLKNFLKFAP